VGVNYFLKIIWKDFGEFADPVSVEIPPALRGKTGQPLKMSAAQFPHVHRFHARRANGLQFAGCGTTFQL
jgi:hypothetical protein